MNQDCHIHSNWFCPENEVKVTATVNQYGDTGSEKNQRTETIHIMMAQKADGHEALFTFIFQNDVDAYCG